jgi:hypothetical protein
MKMVVLAYQAVKNGSRDGSVSLSDIFIDLNNLMELVLQ